MKAGAREQVRGGAAGMAGRARALLRLLFALLLLANGIAAVVQGTEAAGARWNAAEVEGLVAAGLLCDHESGLAGQSNRDQSPAHPCCTDCIACPCADATLAPPPMPLSIGLRSGFHTAGPDLPASQLAVRLPFKLGPPPRAPPHLVMSAHAA